MGEDKSAEEVLEQCLQDMGPELGVFYNALRNDVAWLHAKWKQYRQLYACSPERIDLLNQAAGHFFGVLQDSLLEDVVILLGLQIRHNLSERRIILLFRLYLH